MTGRALFNEVFITDGKVHDNALIGGKSNGWRVANSTLMFERSHLGSGTVPVPTAIPGSIAGQLDLKSAMCSHLSLEEAAEPQQSDQDSLKG